MNENRDGRNQEGVKRWQVARVCKQSRAKGKRWVNQARPAEVACAKEVTQEDINEIEKHVETKEEKTHMEKVKAKDLESGKEKEVTIASLEK
ncbi:hypothetical protein QVD17_02536 [Tagetes erecta]|uniref:Uncharacterized protein n=1 Tax=Tagetes erecta TaxID=13708 RepID=A0AAD8L6S3_TARER|nr:hypothetical protein QVD17_02536 [Tagetes erecta]